MKEKDDGNPSEPGRIQQMKRKPLQLKLPTSYELILSPQGDRMAAIGKINVVTVDTVKMQRLMFCHPFSHPSQACFRQCTATALVKSAA
jgi:hypothetical protein